MKIVLHSEYGHLVWELPEGIARRFEKADAAWQAAGAEALADDAKA
jgi:hypothetical protein